MTKDKQKRPHGGNIYEWEMRRTGYRYKRKEECGRMTLSLVYYISEYINFKMTFFAIRSLSIQY